MTPGVISLGRRMFDVDDDALRCGEWGQAGAGEGRLARADTRP